MAKSLLELPWHVLYVLTLDVLFQLILEFYRAIPLLDWCRHLCANRDTSLFCLSACFLRGSGVLVPTDFQFAVLDHV